MTWRVVCLEHAYFYMVVIKKSKKNALTNVWKFPERNE